MKPGPLMPTRTQLMGAILLLALLLILLLILAIQGRPGKQTIRRIRSSSLQGLRHRANPLLPSIWLND